MQVWRSTSTMPSSRLNEAPVGQTSTQGGSAQCWHMTGAETTLPLFRSLRSTLRIHCESVVRVVPGSPFSRLQASTQSRQPLSHFVVSMSMPQRTLPLTGSRGSLACAYS